MQEYSAYCKKKWCTAGGKDPLFGRVDGFQIGPTFARKKAPLGVQHDIRTVALHEVWLEVVSGFAASGTSQHQDVVVHACFPAVGICAVVLGEHNGALVCFTGVVFGEIVHVRVFSLVDVRSLGLARRLHVLFGIYRLVMMRSAKPASMASSASK